MRRLVLVILLALCFLSAQSSVVNAEVLKVDHIAGNREKLFEKVGLWFNFKKENKVAYYQKILDKRLAEVVYASETNADLIEPTASRYTTYLSNLATYAETNKVTDKKQSLLSQFDVHSKTLKNTQSKYEHNSGWWLALQHDINTLETARVKVQKLE